MILDVLAKLPEITRRIVEHSQPEQIILFGSYARGDTDPDSDLDLLVVVSGVEHLRSESVRLRRILRGLLVPIDVVVATPEQMKRLRNVPGMIYHTAVREGKVIYARESP